MTGQELRAWREHWRLSQIELASMLNVHPNTVGGWERGQREIPGFLALALETLERQQTALLRERLRSRARRGAPVKPAGAA